MLPRIDNRGQAFSVFKLLIAAIIAIAILVILFRILSSIPNVTGQEDPVEQSAQLVQQLKTKRMYHVKSEQKVKFKPNGALSARTISELAQAGLTADQICVSAGDYIDKEDLFVTTDDGRRVDYKGKQPMDTRISVICALGGPDMLDEIEAEYGDSGDVHIRKWFDGISCKCFEDDFVEDTCCLVAVRSVGQ
jgi:hypothetical protein